LQIIAKKKETVSGSPVETEIVKNASGAVASEKKTTYKEITCGGGTRERMTEEITDPGGDALTVTSDYYEDPASESCGRLKSRADSDGSWVRHEYDSEGRKSAVITSWLDAPQGADASAARAVYYDYTPQDASDSDEPGDVRRPRKITGKILGITVSQKYYVYTVDSSGKRTEISEQCAEQPCSYGDPENLRTVAVTHPYTDGYPESWQPESI
ncbi:MAG: hypothetical protein GY795_43020, partial [Desulfobacterales bacterium]|nr:hypothetical protein [Desulfobacterales bacterium]